MKLLNSYIQELRTTLDGVKRLNSIVKERILTAVANGSVKVNADLITIKGVGTILFSRLVIALNLVEKQEALDAELQREIDLDLPRRVHYSGVARPEPLDESQIDSVYRAFSRLLLYCPTTKAQHALLLDIREFARSQGHWSVPCRISCTVGAAIEYVLEDNDNFLVVLVQVRYALSHR